MSVFQVRKCLRGKTKYILATMQRMWCNNSSERRTITYATPTPLWHQTLRKHSSERRRVGTLSYVYHQHVMFQEFFCEEMFSFISFFLGAAAFPQPSSSASLSGFLAFSQNASGETRESKHEESAAGRGVRVGGRTDEERRRVRGGFLF